MHSDMAKGIGKIIDLKARVAELEAALRPFADFYRPTMELAGDDHVLTRGSSMAGRQLTIGDVRRAYKTLNG